MDDQTTSQLAFKIYVATLDDDTCPSCASRHGVRLPADDTSSHVIPNPYCTCRLGCRCTWEPQ